MNKNRLINTAIIVFGLVFISIQVFVFKRFSGFSGTDDQSIDVINEVAPDYDPWINTMFDFSHPQSETILFALQGAMGVGVIVFYIIKQRQKKNCQ